MIVHVHRPVCVGSVKLEHHETRTREVADILAHTERTAYQVAARMTWDMSYRRWEEFPIPQQWFATGEALAHLLHLEAAGRIARRQHDGVTYFSAEPGLLTKDS